MQGRLHKVHPSRKDWGQTANPNETNTAHSGMGVEWV